MPQAGKSHLVIMFTVGPDDVAEGDRIFASHGEFMKGHPREGDVALLGYTVSKGPELANPMDPNSEPTATRSSWSMSTTSQQPASPGIGRTRRRTGRRCPRPRRRGSPRTRS